MVLTDTPYRYIVYTYKGYSLIKNLKEVHLWIEPVKAVAVER